MQIISYKIFKERGLKTKAFTLFEILVVTFIISLVYTMFAINFKTSEKETIKIKTLKEYISKQKYKKYIKLVCLYDEKYCRLYIDDNEKYDSLFLFKDNKEIIVYDFDNDDTLKEIEFAEFTIDEYESKKVSLNMKFFSKNNHKPYLIDDGKQIIYFSTFKNTIIFKSLDKAKEFFDKNKNDFLDIYKEKIRVIKIN
jgi:ABC-type maltose transport system permease subunit